ncbi:MAG: carbohydrate ABC transporter permease [Anaerolineae bacterium]
MTSSLETVPRRRSASGHESLYGYLFVAPAVLGFVVFIAGPILLSMGFSLTDYRLITPPVWAGTKNYAALWQDNLFWQSLKVTLLYAVMALPLGLFFSLALAILMNQKVPGIAFWRTVYYLPAVISGVAVATLWRWILNPEFGLLNSALRYIGIRGPNWLQDTRTALPSLVLIGLWGVGGSMVIYLSGLQGIPSELYEAAEIDGATRRRKLWHVTLPMLSPVIFFNLVMGVIGVFQYFTEPFIITKGGPENATLTYMLYLYRNAFTFFKMGYASALAWVLFVIVFLLTAAVFKSSPMWVHYEAQRGR